MKREWLVILVLVFVSLVMTVCGQVPKVWVASETIKASDLNANFDYVYEKCTNIGSDSFEPGFTIPATAMENGSMIASHSHRHSRYGGDPFVTSDTYVLTIVGTFSGSVATPASAANPTTKAYVDGLTGGTAASLSIGFSPNFSLPSIMVASPAHYITSTTDELGRITYNMSYATTVFVKFRVNLSYTDIGSGPLHLNFSLLHGVTPVDEESSLLIASTTHIIWHSGSVFAVTTVPAGSGYFSFVCYCPGYSNLEVASVTYQFVPIVQRP